MKGVGGRHCRYNDDGSSLKEVGKSRSERVCVGGGQIGYIETDVKAAHESSRLLTFKHCKYSELIAQFNNKP